MKYRTASFAFFIGIMLGTLQVHGQERYISGRVVIEYTVEGKIIRTPLKGIQASISNSEQTAIVGNTATNENGQFFFLNLPSAPYALKLFFGNEELIIDNCEQGQKTETVNSSLLKLNYQEDKQDIGTLIIKKATVRSMK